MKDARYISKQTLSTIVTRFKNAQASNQSGQYQ